MVVIINFLVQANYKCAVFAWKKLDFKTVFLKKKIIL